jgi:nitronate monooxygenase
MIEDDLFSNFLAANTRALRKEIRRARSLSAGILGVNIMVALSNFGELVKTALEEEIDIIFSGAGLPLDLPHYLRACDRTKLVPIVSSGRAARIIAKRWTERYNHPPDAVVVEGPLAGGHLGFKPEQIGDPAYALEVLLADVLTELQPFEAKAARPIPVIVGGDLHRGGHPQVPPARRRRRPDGHRFVTTHECDASLASSRPISGHAGRHRHHQESGGNAGPAIRNQFIDDEFRPESPSRALSLHHHVRLREQPALHCPGPHQRAAGPDGPRLRVRGPQRLSGDGNRLGQGAGRETLLKEYARLRSDLRG